MTDRMTTEELLDALGGLYTPEFGDWVLEVHHILTEPTAPGACIRPEDDASGFGGFQAFGGTVDEAVRNAAALAHAALLDGREFVPAVPWTNPKDNEGLAKIRAALASRGGTTS